MARADFTYFYPVHVRYSEIDMQGVLYNAHYLTYFDTALNEYVLALPYDFIGLAGETDKDFHAVKAAIEFKAPIRYGEHLEIAARTARLGRTSVSFALEIHPAGEDRPLAGAEIVWVYADQQTGKPAPLPDDFRRGVIAREGDAVAGPR